jgi:Ras homolog gene family, member A
MECSSKEMSGVHEIFDTAIDIIVANDRSNQQNQQENGGTGQTGAIRKKKRSCKIL